MSSNIAGESYVKEGEMILVNSKGDLKTVETDIKSSPLGIAGETITSSDSKIYTYYINDSLDLNMSLSVIPSDDMFSVILPYRKEIDIGQYVGFSENGQLDFDSKSSADIFAYVISVDYEVEIPPSIPPIATIKTCPDRTSLFDHNSIFFLCIDDYQYYQYYDGDHQESTSEHWFDRSKEIDPVESDKASSLSNLMMQDFCND